MSAYWMVFDAYGRCPKCGSNEDPFVRYCPGRVGSFGMCQRADGVEDDLLGISDEDEHLHLTCSTCGYRSVVPTRRLAS